MKNTAQKHTSTNKELYHKKCMAYRAEIERLHEALTAANHGDVPAGWDAAIERAEKAEALRDELLMALKDLSAAAHKQGYYFGTVAGRVAALIAKAEASQ